MYFQLFLQLLLSSVAFAAPLADEAFAAQWNTASSYGAGGGVVGFIVLILDLIVWVEVLKSNRPPMDKLLWAVLVFIFPIIGVVIYWLFSNRKAHNTYEPIG